MIIFLLKLSSFIKKTPVALCTIAILVIPFKIQAQEPLLRSPLYVEGYGGASKYFGEFTDISFWIAGGVNVWYRINPMFSVGGAISIGQTRFRVVNDATEYFPTSPQILARVTPIDALFRWNILPYEVSTPYLTVGAGVLSFDVQADNGEYIDLRRVNPTEKTSVQIQRSSDVNNVFQYNLGIGYELGLSRNVTVGFLSRMYFPSTDLLDAIQYENSNNDAFLLTGLSASFGLTSLKGMADIDQDGVPDQVEESLAMNAENPDSDSDGLNDFDELRYHTNPLLKDSDADGIDDRDEIELFKTNPLSTDTDSDGLRDDEESAQGTNPLKPDTDGDSFSDAAEIMLALNPLKPDVATTELINLTTEKNIGDANVRVVKSGKGESTSLKAQIRELQDDLNRQKALLKVTESRQVPVQTASPSRSKTQVDISFYQRRIDSLQYIVALAATNTAAIRDTIFQDREIVREIPKEVIKETIKRDTIFKDREVVREIPKEVIKETIKRDTIFKDREVVREVPKEIIKHDTIRITSAPKEITVRDTVFKDREVVREIPKEIIRRDTVFKDVVKEVVREIPKEITIRDTVFKDREVIREIPKEIVREIPKEVIREVIKRDTVFKTNEIIREIPKEIIKRDTVFKTREIIRRDTVEIAAEPLKIFIRDTIFRNSGEIIDMPAGPPGLSSVRFTPKPIYFAPNSTELATDADEAINYVIAFMREYPESIVEISGYADSVGTPEANKLVTQRRTGAVAQRLMQAGVDPTRLVERAYGNITMTIQDPKERRVEFKLLKLVRF